MITANDKRLLVNKVHAAIMNHIESSEFKSSPLYPKNGFKTGSFPKLTKHGNYVLETICIKIIVDGKSGLRKVRFNIWNKSERKVIKQYKQLSLLFENSIIYGIFFYHEFLQTDRVPMHSDDEDRWLMGMLDFKFKIED